MGEWYYYEYPEMANHVHVVYFRYKRGLLWKVWWTCMFKSEQQPLDTWETLRLLTCQNEPGLFR
jgi:hypothetical protein